MTDYEEEITLPETTSSAAASSTTEKLSTLTLEKEILFHSDVVERHEIIVSKVSE